MGAGSFLVPSSTSGLAGQSLRFGAMQPNAAPWTERWDISRCVPGPVQKPWQLSSDTSWQQEATTATPVLGSMGLWGLTALPRPRPLPRLGKAEHGPARPFATLGVDAQGPTVGSAFPHPPMCPQLFPSSPRPAVPLPCPCIVGYTVHIGVCDAFSCSRSLLGCVRDAGGEAGRERVCVCNLQGHL